LQTKKICFILGSLWEKTIGGSEYQVKLIIDQLKHTGNYDLYYIYTGKTFSEEEVDGVKYFTLLKRSRKFGTPFCVEFFRVCKILDKIKPDIIYQRSGSALTGISAYYAKKNNIKMIWHIAHKNDVKRPWIKWTDFRFPLNYLDRMLLKYGITNAQYIIGQAKYQDELLQKNYQKHCDLIVSNFHPKPEADIKKNNPVKVVWIANYKKWKQPELFLELVEEFTSNKDIVFFMIGRPKNEDWQKIMQQKETKLKNFHYLGEQKIEEVNRILCESHIFINTSRHEGFPNTFIQAWLRRVPVISLNVDPDGLIKENGLGRLSLSFSQMVEDVGFLLDHPDIRESIGEKAQKFALQTFSLNNIKEIIGLFNKIVLE